jgi:hypothetical protein
MANLIRTAFTLFWMAATGFIGYLAYAVIQTEGNPQVLWSWLVLCGLTFLSVSFLAYVIILGGDHKANAPHHHKHLSKSEE